MSIVLHLKVSVECAAGTDIDSLELRIDGYNVEALTVPIKVWCSQRMHLSPGGGCAMGRRRNNACKGREA